MSDPRRPITPEQIAQVHRTLADDYARECARASADRTWKRLSQKLEQREQRTLTRRLGQRVQELVATFPWLNVSSRARVGRGLAFALAFAILFAVGTFGWLQRSSELSFQVVGGQTDGDWVQSKETPVLLEFSDGSELQMHADSLISVNVIGRRSALTRVSKGDLRVDVQHADRTDWRFFAGPFEVRVVGTKFDMSWRDDKLSVAMREGTVRVVGPEREWTLRSGERLEMTAPSAVSHKTQRPALAVAAVEPAEEGARSADVPAFPAMQQPVGARGQKRPKTLQSSGNQAQSTLSNSENSWKQLLAKGEFAALVSAAKEQGIDSAIQTRSSEELVALAQAARYARELGLSRKVWLGVRSRFGGSNVARDAAFYLGRIDEQSGQTASALELYTTYLKESRYAGAYTPEAMGRRLVILRQTHAPSAVNEARTYLAQFPTGAYAKLAQDTVGSER